MASLSRFCTARKMLLLLSCWHQSLDDGGSFGGGAGWGGHIASGINKYSDIASPHRPPERLAKLDYSYSSQMRSLFKIAARCQIYCHFCCSTIGLKASHNAQRITVQSWAGATCAAALFCHCLFIICLLDKQHRLNIIQWKLWSIKQSKLAYILLFCHFANDGLP